MTGVCCLRCYGSKEIVFDSNNLEYPGTPAYSSGSFNATCRRVPCPLCCPPSPSQNYDPATFTSDWGPFAAATSDKHPPQIPMAGGIAASSPCPPFHLIPTIGLIGLAERFQKGVDRKGDKAWNATSSNQACLKDKEFAIERISHIIDHAMKLRDKLKANNVAGMAEDDDAGAIAWAGIFLYCVVDGMKKDAEHESSS